MGLQIQRAEDLDILQVLGHAPEGDSSLRYRALMQGAEIHLSRRQANACVIHIKGKRPQIFLNPDFIEQNVDNYYELFTIIFHEMAHIMVGHFIEPKIKVLFGDDFWATREGAKIKNMSEELLIKHLEHIALPEDHYHTITEKSFRPLGEPMNIFFRGTPEEEIEDPLYQAIHNRVFETGTYSAREAAYVMRRRLENDPNFGDGEQGDNPWDNVHVTKGNGNGDTDGPTVEAQGEAGEGGEEGDAEDSNNPGGAGKPPEQPEPEPDEDGSAGGDDGSPSDSEEGVDDSVSDDADEEGKEDSDQVGDEDASDPSGGDAEGEQDGEGDPEDGEGEEAPQGGSQSSADDEGLQALMEAMADMTGSGAGKGGTPLAAEMENVLEPFRIINLPEIKRAVVKVFREPGFINQVARVFRETAGRAVDYSIIPDTRRDKRAAARMAAGIYTPYYRKPVRDIESKFHLYFDISGSQRRYIPVCNELVMRLKPYLATDGLMLFSTYVKPLHLTEYMRAVKEGTVRNHGSGGTNFNVVIDDIVRRKLTHVAILTDNEDDVSGHAPDGRPRDTVLKEIAAKGYLLLILTHSQPWEAGFRPHANKEITIEHDH